MCIYTILSLIGVQISICFYLIYSLVMASCKCFCRLLELCGCKRRERTGQLISDRKKNRRRRYDQLQEPENEIVEVPEELRDPLMAKLEDIQKEIDNLAREADEYKDVHINQDYRRLNAEFGRLQIALDKINVEGREDARLIKKKGILSAERAAEALCVKIHVENHTTCPDCLQI